MSRRLQADLLLLLMCVFWGGTFVLVKEALSEVSTLLFLTLRFGCAAIALFAFGGRPARQGMIVGVFLFLGYALQTQGLRGTTPSRSAFITALAVILVPMLHSLVLRKLPSWGVTFGATIATIGVYLLTNPAGSTSIGRGDLLTLGCALAFAIHILLVSHYSPQTRALDLATGQMCTATLLGAICFPLMETPVFHSTVNVWMAVAVTGLICTALGFFVQAWAQRFTTPSHAALVYSSEPVFAWITSMLLLGERLGTVAALGALLILGGIIASELVV